MEKRVLLAVFLSFLVLYAYQAIVPQPKRPALEKLLSAHRLNPTAPQRKKMSQRSKAL